jgi:hypothetical protein
MLGTERIALPYTIRMAAQPNIREFRVDHARGA